MQLFIARLLKGYTQQELSKKIGISRYKICFFENGYIKPNEAELAKLTDVLDIKPEELEFNKRKLRENGGLGQN